MIAFFVIKFNWVNFNMIKIMFVCHGNICRSPMAEFILKDMVGKSGLSDEFYITSSATSTEEIYGGIGNPVYPPARRILEKHGIFCDGKRAVRLTKNDYESYDYLICMDERNIRNAIAILGSDKDKKLSKLMSWAGESGDVADPWYSGDFEAAYNDIYEGCKGLLCKLTEGR